MSNNGDNKIKRRPFEIPMGGAGNAARSFGPSVASLNRRLDGGIAPKYIDPALGKAQSQALADREMGVPASYIEARIEDTPLDGSGPIVLHVDRPEPILAVLERAPPRAEFLAYLVIASAGLPLLGLMVALGKHDLRSREGLTQFMRSLAQVTARSGSERVLGDRASLAHRGQEAGVRREFIAHFERNLPRFAGGLELEDAPITLTRGGMAAEAVIVLSPAGVWRTPSELERGLADHATVPLLRGSNLVLIEPNTAGALRIHSARLRLSDGALSVGGAVLPGQRGLMAALPGAAGRATEALARSMTLTAEWSRFNGVATSD